MDSELAAPRFVVRCLSLMQWPRARSLTFVMTGADTRKPGDLLVMDRDNKTASSFRKAMLKPRGACHACMAYVVVGCRFLVSHGRCRQRNPELGPLQVNQQDQANGLAVSRGTASRLDNAAPFLPC